MMQELAWADAEDNPYFMPFFGKLAELQFLCSEMEKQMAEKVIIGSSSLPPSSSPFSPPSSPSSLLPFCLLPPPPAPLQSLANVNMYTFFFFSVP